MKLLVDMNLSPRWVAWLAREGIEATHWSTVGAATATDEEIMAYAGRNGFVVFTHDLDFGAILAATHGTGPSVVQIRASDVNPDIIGAWVVQALRQMQGELTEGALLTIDPTRARLRLLPFLSREVK